MRSLVFSAGKVAYGYVHHLQPVCVTDQIVGEHYGSLQACVCPSRFIRMRYVESSNGDGMDFVGLFRNEALDGFLVVVIQNRRHGETVEEGYVEVLWWLYVILMFGNIEDYIKKKL